MGVIKFKPRQQINEPSWVETFCCVATAMGGETIRRTFSKFGFSTPPRHW